ncbi:MAG: DUF938 domain-containing protein [Proteobacteria bacterium]|nr:MAG: DUF938 domain-containing protein [Pseudomonadota bacterium]QKK11428.1 MAG: DUF938 domain-containing protein [Pseudomonadota bacterium]
MKPFCESADQNKAPILAVLRELLTVPATVFEIASGTGQHAVHFAGQLPHIQWQTSELPERLPGIGAWLEEAALANTPAPIALDVLQQPWPDLVVDAAYSANTAHILHWPQVEAMFRGVAGMLRSGGLFCLYGPFRYGGVHISESNTRFDASLRARDPGMGVRDVDDLNRLALESGLAPTGDYVMPVNNRILVWRRTARPE